MFWIKWNISFRPIIAPWESIKQNPWISMTGKSERSHYVHQPADQTCPVKSYDFCLSLCRFFGRPRMYESPFAALDVAKLLEWFEVPSPTSHADWHSLSHPFWTSPALQPQLKARSYFLFSPQNLGDPHFDLFFRWGCWNQQSEIDHAQKKQCYHDLTARDYLCLRVPVRPIANDRPHVCFRWDWWG